MRKESRFGGKPRGSIKFLFSVVLILYLLFVFKLSVQFQSLSLNISPYLASAAAQTTQAEDPTAKFQILLNNAGVTLYRKEYSSASPDYVTIVDLDFATLCNLTGPVNGEVLDRQTLTQFWQEAASQNIGTYQLQVVLNGTFFGDEPNNTADIAFGLKSHGQLITYGYGLNEYPGLNKTFAFDTTSAQIQPYQSTTFDAPTPDVIGALAAEADKSSSRRLGRTFVGVMNSHSNTADASNIVLFFSSAAATQAHAEAVLKAFGATEVAMLDGGGSTGLLADNTAYIPTDRALPHAIAIYTGKSTSLPPLL